MVKSKLKETLEKEGFEQIGGTFVISDKSPEEKYFTFNTLLTSSLIQDYSEVAISLVKTEKGSDHFATFYGKK